MRVEGLLVTTSPLHVASPEDARVDLGTARFVKGDAGVPCTRTQRMAVVKADVAEDESNTDMVPVFPANDLRGRLRREIADIVFELLLEKGEKLSLDAYHVLTCGAASGSPDKGGFTVPEIVKYSQHPVLGLLGGGPKMLRSSLRVDTAFMVCPTTVANGMIPEAFQQRATDPWRALTVLSFKKIDDALTFTNPITGEIVADYHNAMDAWMGLRAELMQDKAAKKKAPKDKPAEEVKAKKPAKLDTWSSLEAVVPGTAFFFRFEATSSEDAHAGLLLLGLERLVNKQNLGGWVRNGFGRYNLKHVTLYDGTMSRGAVFVEGPGGYQLDRSNTTIAALLAAFEDAAGEITAATLETFSKSSGKTADDEGEEG